MYAAEFYACSAFELVHTAFYFMHYDLFEGKNRRICLLDAINKPLFALERNLIEMSEKKKPASTAQTPFESIKFVNKNLTAEEKQAHDDANRPIEYVAVQYLKLSNEGYSLKVGYDAYSKCMQATMLVWNKACSNFGYGLSARGATAERAVSLLLYKHFEVLKQNWTTSYQAPIVDMEG